MSKLKIAILGPTASGKSALAVTVAKHIGGTVVNGDPFQAYRGLSLGTGQPSKNEKGGVLHLGYGVLPLSMRINPFTFGSRVRSWTKCKHPVLVTGSGLYLRGIWGQLTDLPPVPEYISSKVRLWSDTLKASVLYGFLAAVDPIRAKALHPNDRPRVQRAISLYLATGYRASQLLDGIKQGVPSDWRVLLVLPSSEHRQYRIARRVMQMLADGWLKEVANLVKLGFESEIRCLRPIGYVSLLDAPIIEATERIIRETQDYSKRQSTFFRNQWPSMPIWNPDTSSLDVAFGLLNI
jgi:tRNA dimethylallyltransferase